VRLRLLIALAAVLVTAAPAWADLTVRGLDTSRWPDVKLTVTVDTPPGSKPDLGVTENGKAVKQLDVQSPDGQTAVALVIDNSGSMGGNPHSTAPSPLTQAIAGAQQYLNLVKTGDQIAVITLGHEALVAQPMTTDVEAAKAAVAGITRDLTAGTVLNDAVIQGVKELNDAHSAARRVMIVLTDGTDNGSAAKAKDAIDAAVKAGVTIFTIGLQTGSFSPDALEALSNPTGGSFRPANLATIGQTYNDIANELAHTFIVSYKSTASQHISVVVTSGADAAQTGYQGGAPAVLQTGNGVVPKWITTAWWSTFAISLLVFGIVLAAVASVVRPRPKKTVDKQLQGYTEFSKRKPEDQGEDHVSVISSLSTSTDRIMRNVQVWKKIDALIEQADLPIKTAELFYIQLGCAMLLGIPAGFAGVFPLLTLGLFVVGFFLPVLFVRFKARKRQKAFDNQLPDTLIAMAASLKAGHSWNQAVETIIKDGGEPISKEFGRVSSEVRLGRTSDDALEAMAKRLQSPDFEFVVMSVGIQRQVGGSLAELLDQIAETVRHRQQFRRKVKALCAMGRMSAYTLVSLPFLMGLGITAINSSYMAPLFNTSTGIMLVIIAVTSIGIGALILKKIVSFKV
jgi:tight adherence protein B